MKSGRAIAHVSMQRMHVPHFLATLLIRVFVMAATQLPLHISLYVGFHAWKDSSLVLTCCYILEFLILSLNCTLEVKSKGTIGHACE